MKRTPSCVDRVARVGGVRADDSSDDLGSFWIFGRGKSPAFFDRWKSAVSLNEHGTNILWSIVAAQSMGRRSAAK